MKFDFQKRQGPQTFVTENYVSSPPALIVMDERGSVWTLGFVQGPAPHGEFSFEVLKDGNGTGVFASRIERKAGRIRVFTREGWRVWNGRSFT